MSNLLEITGDDIAQLDDAALRELIGLLCEADYQLGELSTKGITWGGHQDAPDGGLDVAIRCEDDPPKVSFIPRKTTGFQVKKSDMPSAKIIAEMQPDGYLRDEIKNLIKEGGAYIIVSSSGSTTDKALRTRIAAMRKTISEENGNEKFVVDFFDRNRIASWVRSHSSIILWVRNKIGRNFQGWRSYGNWANSPEGIEEEYLLDDRLRLRDGTQLQRTELPIQEGLLLLRSTLSVSRASVRLTGLSGVGKTRLVQALFDKRIGSQALSTSLPIYTDISYNPEPSPESIAEQLISRKTKAILIVDNCPPDLHRRLTEICSQQHSNVSLLTIEYEVREDISDETNVFILEPASEELIEKLIHKRYPHISQVNANTIAHFSGGNARIAIALANTVKRNETLSDFSDDELFKRLFWQNQVPNENLLLSAEVCSLVYSFEGEDTHSEKSELSFLASLIDKTSSELYRDVNTIKERNLIQSRGVWRAVLPHAIANRLAKRALKAIPRDKLLEAFLNFASERLIRSFSKRLSYLHDCEPAIEIVHEWLSPVGWLGKENCNFNQLGLDVFNNIASVSPEEALLAIERAANNDKENRFFTNVYYRNFVNILFHLAYDPELFNRSVEILIRSALIKSEHESNNPERDSLKSLFWITLSGTHASVETRAKVIKTLLISESANSQQLGLNLLSGALEAWHFYTSRDFRFGARPRDFGFHPKTRNEVDLWFSTYISICTDLALSNENIASKARRLLADKMRGLWTGGNMYDALEDSAEKIHNQKSWNDGWLAVRQIIQLDSKNFDEGVTEKILRLEKFLKPVNLLERARVFSLSNQFDRFNVEDDLMQEDEGGNEMPSWQRANKITRELGFQVAQDIDTFNALLPELFSTYASRLYIFGQGLADGSEDKQIHWQLLYDQFKKTDPEKRQIVVLVGYLSSLAENEPEFYNSILDSLVNDEFLGKWFPYFQGAAKIDQRGVKRLNEALDTGHVMVDAFRDLAWGRRHEAISDDDLADLLIKLQKLEGGASVVIDVLQMRFHESEEKQIEHSRKLIETVCSFLEGYQFTKDNLGHNNSYYLAQITKVCFSSKFGANFVLNICEHLAKFIVEYRIYSFEYTDLFSTIALIKPVVFLDTFLENSMNIENYSPHLVFRDSFEERNIFIDQIDEDILINWCKVDAETRYPLLASVTKLFSIAHESKELRLNRTIYLLLNNAPNRAVILQNLSKSISPMSWSGSLAELLLRRAELLKELFAYEDEEVKSWAKEQYSALQKEAKYAHEDEEKRNRFYNERFE